MTIIAFMHVCLNAKPSTRSRPVIARDRLMLVSEKIQSIGTSYNGGTMHILPMK